MERVACPLPRRLRAPAPLDLEHTLFSGQAFRWQRHGNGYSGFIVGEHVRLKLVGGTFSGVASGQLGDDDVARYFRADVDLRAIEREWASDPHVGAAMRSFPGLRILRQDPWETLVSFVLSSVSNIPKITRTVEALASMAGEPKALGDAVRNAFPTPARLAKSSNPELRATGMGFRANYLQGVAGAVARGDLDLEALRKESYEGAVEVLTGLPGVGRKVADCVLLFAYDHAQAFPVDVWVRRGLRRLYVKRRMSDEKLRRWAVRRWNGWAGYAQQYLFHAERQGGDENARIARGNRAVTPRAHRPTTVK